MADGKVIIEIDGDDSGFAGKLQNVDITASKLAGGALKALAKGTVAVGTAFAGSAAGALAAGSAYETAFAKTATIMDSTVVSAQDMSAAILDLSDDTGAAAKDISSSVYDAISATSDTANAVNLVADASKLAVAGFAEQADALSVLTTITNAYGIATTEAKTISDSLIQTQNLGVTTVGQLASSMGKAIATASAYSIDLYNLESAYVSLTKAGISTEESTTYLSSMFNELGDSGSDVATIIRTKTGKSFGQLMKSGASLGDVLDILLESVNGDTEALANLWGSAEAGKASLAIAGQGVDTFNSNLNSLRNSAGTTEAAYETMTETLGFQTEKLGTRITNLGTAVYDYFDESIVAGVSGLSDAFSALTDSVSGGELADEMEQIGSGINSLIESGVELASDALPVMIEGFAWLVDNGSTVATSIGTAAAAYGAYQVATTAATIAQNGFNLVASANPVGLLAAGITVSVGAFATLVSAVKETTEYTSEVSDSVAETEVVVESVTAAIYDAIDAYNEAKATVAENATVNSKNIDSLLEMVDAYDGTAGSAALIQGVIAELNTAIPGLNLAFDEQTGTLNRSKEAMEALNAEYAAGEKRIAAMDKEATTMDALTDAQSRHDIALQDLEKAQAAYNSEYQDSIQFWALSGVEIIEQIRKNKGLKDAVDAATQAEEKCAAAVKDAAAAHDQAVADVVSTTDAYVDAVNAAEEFEEETQNVVSVVDEEAAAVAEATQAVAKIGTETYNAIYSGEDLRDTYDELRGQMDELTGAGDPYIESLTEQALAMLEIGATAEDLRVGYGDLTASLGLSSTSIASMLVSLGMSADEFASGCESMRDRVINSFEAIEVNEELTASQIAENLQNNLAVHNEWSSNLQSIWNSTQDETIRAFVLYMYDQGPEYALAVSQFAAGGTAELQAAAYDWAAIGDETAQSYLTRIYGQTELAGAAGTDLGDATGAGVISGIEGTTEGVQTSSQALIDAATTTWDAASADFESTGSESVVQIITGINSQEPTIIATAQALIDAITSTWTAAAGSFETSGSDAGESINSGLGGQSGAITGTASDIADDTEGAFSSGSWYSVGYNISSGVASGVYGGSYLITSAARSAAYSALASAKSALGVHSPSRVFQDEIGKMIPAGIAVGIEDATPDMTSAMDDSTAQLLATAREAVRPTVDAASTSYITNHTTTNYGGGRQTVVLVDNHLDLDGREIARGTAKYTGRQLAFSGV